MLGTIVNISSTSLFALRCVEGDLWYADGSHGERSIIADRVRDVVYTGGSILTNVVLNKVLLEKIDSASDHTFNTGRCSGGRATLQRILYTDIGCLAVGTMVFVVSGSILPYQLTHLTYQLSSFL